jgi:hypothetical protein
MYVKSVYDFINTTSLDYHLKKAYSFKIRYVPMTGSQNSYYRHFPPSKLQVSFTSPTYFVQKKNHIPSFPARSRRHLYNLQHSILSRKK